MQSPANGAPWTAADAVEFATHTLAFARQRRKEVGGEVPAAAFLLVPGEWRMVLGVQALPGHLRGPALREAAREAGAQYVVHVFEAWTAITETPDEVEALRAHKEAGNGASTWPDRQEALLCSVDGPGLSRLWICAILPDGSTGEPCDALGPGMRASGNMIGLSGRQGEN